jgi:DNA-binding CsgD family transcriptional regulator
VDHFDLLQEFIERADRATDVGTLAASFERSIATLGFRSFACCSHVDPLLPPRRAVVMYTYPEEWVRSFSERKLFNVDPVFKRADATMRPFFWDSGEFRADLTEQQQAILAEASAHGIAHGYTVPIHLPGPRGACPASCSVVADESLAEQPTKYVVQLMAYFLYDAAIRLSEAVIREAESSTGRPATIELSNRERQCLELVAQGKSDWVAGKLLGISERTVHNHIERAKRRLGVTTRVQAIVHALATGQISFGDVIKAERIRPTPER